MNDAGMLTFRLSDYTLRDCSKKLEVAMDASHDIESHQSYHQRDRLPWHICAPILVIFSLLGWVFIVLPFLFIFGII